MPHAITVDVEDWQQLLVRYLAAEEIPPTSHVVEGIQILLRLFDEAAIQGTFFVTGRVAESFPSAIRDIDDAGHEVAAHGWDHRPVAKMSPEQFAKDLRRTLDTLQDITQRKVMGYRAPYFGLGPEQKWVWEVLLEQGLSYDSSMSPKYWPVSNGLGHRQGFHRLENVSGELYEMPVTSGLWLGRRWTVSGGRYFRSLPFGVIRKAFMELDRRGLAGQLYIHTYEVLPYKLQIPRRLPTFAKRCLGQLYEAAYNVGRRRTWPRALELVKQLPGWGPIRELVTSARMES